MEEVEITTTLEIMVDSSPTTDPWRETTLVAETRADPMAVSVPLRNDTPRQNIPTLPLTYFPAGGYSSGGGGGGGGGYGSRRY